MSFLNHIRCLRSTLPAIGILLVCFLSPVSAQTEWTTPGFGNWSQSSNWSNGVPNGVGAVAIFGPATGDELVVVIDGSPVTVGELVFAAPGFVTIDGTETIELAVAQGQLPALIVDPPSPQAQIFAPIQGTQGLVKAGAGSLILEGPLNVGGPALVAQGDLVVGAFTTLSADEIVVQELATLDVASHPIYQLAPGQMLGGGGTVVANVLQIGNDNFVEPGSGTGTLMIDGSLELVASLPFATGGLQMELSPDPSDPLANDSIHVGGDLSFAGVQQFDVRPVGNQLANGTYPLINYDGVLNAAGANLLVRHDTRLNMSIDSSDPGLISLNVSGAVGELLWQGNTDSDWDINTTPNWIGGGGFFLDLDAVRFDDTATRFNVSVAQDVRPGEVIFENSANDYVVSGPAAIRGAAGLRVVGGGLVTFQNDSEFGQVDIEQGTIEIGASGSIVASDGIGVETGGELRLAGGQLEAPKLTVLPGGQWTGTGLFVGDAMVGDDTVGSSSAVLSPGFSPGTIEIEGDLELGSNSEVVIEISGLPGNPHDMVVVNGDSDLDGVLRIDAIDGYTPQVGDEFVIMVSNSRIGDSEFDDVEATRVGDVVMWPCYDDGSVIVTGELIGDMDLSGLVDEDDIPFFAFALRDNAGYDDALLCTEYEMADIDGNGRVDFGDIAPFAARVQQNSGLSAVQVATAVRASLAIPEPTGFSLMLLAICAGLVPRRGAATGARGGFTLVELLVVIAIISVLIALLLPAVQAAREAARKTKCANHAKQLGVALHAYEGHQSVFPEGALAHRQVNVVSIGWHVLILPYLEQQQLYDQVGPTADGGAADHNISVHAVPVFHCPSAEPPFIDLQRRNGSNYVGVAGAGRGGNRIDLEDRSCGDLFTDGLLTFGEPVSIARLTDGTSNTLAIGERVYRLEEWTYGAKWRGEPLDQVCVGATKNMSFPINANRENVGYYVRDFSVTPSQRSMVRNDLLFGSDHPGGAHFTFGDGSVHFLTDAMDFTLLQDLATGNGSEPVQFPG